MCVWGEGKPFWKRFIILDAIKNIHDSLEEEQNINISRNFKIDFYTKDDLERLKKDLKK